MLATYNIHKDNTCGQVTIIVISHDKRQSRNYSELSPLAIHVGWLSFSNPQQHKYY
jgi:hypothetical protein